ncbi:unnamed protein product [Clonostachys solani]|uniref:Prion-inhibition and propagation HeLo domain-containing protein n=1 Tax=Clonostachys solani TaxID=160281 RepID=A0A9N9WC41_9HYPO|nr:unnamed protein product [Clonostachys solani]
MAGTSLINLASTFDSVIRIFEYIHFAETFGADYEDSLLKLDNVNLRLSRWGEAVGLSNVSRNTRTLRGTKVVPEHIPQASNLLGAILAALEAAKDMDQKYNPDDPSIIKAEESLSYTGLSLHDVHQRIIGKRQNNLSAIRKVTWVLRDRERFKVMIDRIVDKTKELEDLFPAARTQEKTIIDQEALELSESLRVLKYAISEQDQALASALDAILKPLKETVDNTVYGGNVGVMAAKGSTFTQHIGDQK